MIKTGTLSPRKMGKKDKSKCIAVSAVFSVLSFAKAQAMDIFFLLCKLKHGPCFIGCFWFASMDIINATVCLQKREKKFKWHGKCVCWSARKLNKKKSNENEMKKQRFEVHLPWIDAINFGLNAVINVRHAVNLKITSE